jgi:type II secretory pathway component PulF
MPIEVAAPERRASRAGRSALMRSELFKRKPGRVERMFLTEQLALLLDTGVSLYAALQIIRRETDNPGLQRLLDDLAHKVEAGEPFSEALAEHPDVFDLTYVNLIAASEHGGFMHEVLEQLLEMDKRVTEMNRALAGALAYPAFLLVFSTAVVVFVLVVVFPRFDELFVRIADELPWTTKVLMSVSHSLMEDWPIMVGVLAGVIFGFRLWLASEGGRRMFDAAVLRAPLIGSVLSELYLVRTLRVMSLSLTNGVSVLDTLSASGQAVNNHTYRAFLGGVRRRVEEGAGIAAGFSSSAHVPDIVQQMIATGEESGSLPRVMLRVAVHYEEQLTHRLQMISRSAEPVLLVVMGGLVGLIVSSLILPIFKLSAAVR